MKSNLLPLLIQSLALTTSVGCKKYTCSCVAYDGFNGKISETSNSVLKGPKPKAKQDCNNLYYKDTWGNHQVCELN